ncbi:MAG: DUF4349 domain-containing protein [Lachnotalea sp.]
MKNKTIKRIVTSIVILANILLLVACGSKNTGTQSTKMQSVGTATESSDMAVTDTANSVTAATTDKLEVESVQGIESTQGLVNSNTNDIAGQKLIKDVNISVETKEFDAFLVVINNQIASLEGYVQNSDVSGGSYQYESYRYGSIVARIPADKLDGFINIISENGNVVQTSQNTTDVTLQYVDMESHIKALKTEQETLLGLLENATSMEDVIAIQSQLTQVRYELESNESQIRTYDNLVDYSTVTINITEVERETDTQATSFGDEIRIKFGNNLYQIREGFRSFTIDFISALPYLVIWAVVIVMLVIVGKKVYKKYTKKLRKENEKEATNEEKEKGETNEEKEN